MPITKKRNAILFFKYFACCLYFWKNKFERLDGIHKIKVSFTKIPLLLSIMYIGVTSLLLYWVKIGWASFVWCFFLYWNESVPMVKCQGSLIFITLHLYNLYVCLMIGILIYKTIILLVMAIYDYLTVYIYDFFC